MILVRICEDHDTQTRTETSRDGLKNKDNIYKDLYIYLNMTEKLRLSSKTKGVHPKTGWVLQK